MFEENQMRDTIYYPEDASNLAQIEIAV